MPAYPELPAARARVLAADLLVLLVIVVCVLLAGRAHDAVAALADPARTVEATAAGVGAELDGGLDLPIIGRALDPPLQALAGVSRQVGDVATSQAEVTMRAAGATRAVVLVPALVVLGLRVRHRLRWARAAAEAVRARSTRGGEEVLALRAAVNAPLRHVVGVTGAVGSGPLDPAHVAPLAALELARLGLRPAGASTAAEG